MMGFTESESLYHLKRDISHLIEVLNDFEANDVEMFTFVEGLKATSKDMEKQVVVRIIDTLKKGN